MTPADLDLLIHRYFEGTLSPAEEVTFLDLLRGDPAAADRFVEWSELESGMLESLREDEEMPSAVYAVVHGTRRRTRALRTPEPAKPVWPYWAAAALFILAVTLVLRSPGSQAPEVVTRPPEGRPFRTPAPVRSKADLEADREKHQEAIRKIEREEQVLHEARAKAQEEQRVDRQQDLERKMAQVQDERREEASKLARIEEDLAKPEPTHVAPPVPTPGPLLESVEGEVAWTGEAAKAARSGDAVPPGSGLVTRGPRSRAVLRLVDETRIELRGDSRLDGIQAAGDPKTFTLALGTLAATVTKQPATRSVVFLTPHAEMTVVGTRLVVMAGLEETRLDVEEGHVRNKRLSDKRSIDVFANHTVTTARSGPLVAKALPVVRSFQDGVLPTPDYAGTRDTSIGNASPTAVSGSMDLLRLYREPKGDLQNLVLLRWDVSSIPKNSRVTAAEMSFWVTGGLAPPGARAFEMKLPWEEAEATWKSPKPGVPWHPPVGRNEADVGLRPLAAIAPTLNGWSTFPVNEEGVALVQRWVNAPGSNLGFVILKEPPNAWDLASREWATPEHRPKLTVSYLPPAK